MKFIAVLFSLLLTSCAFSARPIYYDQEQAIAERAVSQFHTLHNRKEPEAIYELLDKTGFDNQQRAKILAEIKATCESVGNVLSSTLVEKKVFPVPGPVLSSQVKLSYDTKFEKGTRTEFFAWNIKNSREAMLVEYRILPPTNETGSER